MTFMFLGQPDVTISIESSRFEQEIPCNTFGFSPCGALAAGGNFNATGKAENRTNSRKEAEIEKIRIAVVDSALVLRCLDEMRASLHHPVEVAIDDRLEPVAGFVTFENRETVKVGVARTDVDQSTDAGTELIGRRLRGLGDGGIVQNAQAALKTVRHHGLPQAFFRFEVIKQKALRNLGIIRNLPCGGAGKAIRRKTASRRTNDPRPRCFWKVKGAAHAGPLPFMSSS